MPSFYKICQVQGVASRNRYGQATLSRARTVRCDIVELSYEQVATRLRADSTASRGTAKEPRRMLRFLFPFEEKVGRTDVIDFEGDKFEVLYARPRYNAFGQPHHIEIEAVSWLE